MPYLQEPGEGQDAEMEAAEAADAIKRLGGSIERIETYPIGEALHRVVENSPSKKVKYFGPIPQVGNGG